MLRKIEKLGALIIVNNLNREAIDVEGYHILTADTYAIAITPEWLIRVDSRDCPANRSPKVGRRRCQGCSRDRETVHGKKSVVTRVPKPNARNQVVAPRAQIDATELADTQQGARCSRPNYARLPREPTDKSLDGSISSSTRVEAARTFRRSLNSMTSQAKSP